MICFESKTVFKALHLGERMECAYKTWFLPLHPVYRIMHSIPGSSVACLSNLMRPSSKWNVSGSCQDESFCLLAPRFDQMAAKIRVMHTDVLGRQTDSVNEAIKQMLHQAISVVFEPRCTPLHMLVLRDWVPRGEWGQSARTHFSQGDIGVFVGGGRYKQLSESWYQLNPLTIYIFTSTSLLASQ